MACFPFLTNLFRRLFSLSLVLLLSATLVHCAQQVCSAQAPGKEKADAQPIKNRELTDDDLDVVPVRFGEPLQLKSKDGQVVRIIYLYRGRSAVDKENESSKPGSDGYLTYYHGLLPTPRVNEKATSELPNIVHRVSPRGKSIFLQMQFHISSDKLRQRCVAALTKHELGLRPGAIPKDAKIRVERMPVRDLVIAINDSVSGLSLAFSSRNIRGEGDIISMWFEFDANTLALFNELWAKDEIEFVCASLINARKMTQGGSTTKVDFSVDTEVRSQLTSEQLAKKVPIFQSDVNRITRNLAAKIEQHIVADDESVVKLFKSDALILAGVFDPAQTVTIDQLVNKDNYDKRMIAEYLKPLVQSTIDSHARSHHFGGQHTTEEIKINIDEGTSPGFIASLFVSGGGGTEENRLRTLNSNFQSTGIEWSHNEGKKWYEPHSIRTYKLAQGYEKKKVSQNMMVALGKGPFNAYIRDAAVPKWLDAQTLNELLDDLPLRKEQFPPRSKIEPVQVGGILFWKEKAKYFILYWDVERNELLCYGVGGPGKHKDANPMWPHPVRLDGPPIGNSVRLEGKEVVLQTRNFRFHIDLADGKETGKYSLK